MCKAGRALLRRRRIALGSAFGKLTLQIGDQLRGINRIRRCCFRTSPSMGVPGAVARTRAGRFLHHGSVLAITPTLALPHRGGGCVRRVAHSCCTPSSRATRICSRATTLSLRSMCVSSGMTSCLPVARDDSFLPLPCQQECTIITGVSRASRDQLPRPISPARAEPHRPEIILFGDAATSGQVAGLIWTRHWTIL